MNERLFKVMTIDLDEHVRIDFDICKEDEIDEVLEALILEARRNGYKNFDWQVEPY